MNKHRSLFVYVRAGLLCTRTGLFLYIYEQVCYVYAQVSFCIYTSRSVMYSHRSLFVYIQAGLLCISTGLFFCIWSVMCKRRSLFVCAAAFLLGKHRSFLVWVGLFLHGYRSLLASIPLLCFWSIAQLPAKLLSNHRGQQEEYERYCFH